MNRALKIIAVLVAAAATAAAQEAAPAAPAQGADASSIILAPTPAATQPAPAPGAAGQPVSSAINADISSGMPHYNAGFGAPKPASSAQDRRDVDKPKNLIPRLPTEVMSRYVVHGARLPVFRTRDLYTKTGLIALALKEHPGLHIGNFFNLNSNIAYQMAMKEAILDDRQDLVDMTLAMAAGGDKQEAEVMQQALIDESFENGGQEGPVGIK
jgi:hypothetical protein